MDEEDPGSRLALALDVPDLAAAKRLIGQTRDAFGTYKVGLELFTAVGPGAIDVIHEAGARSFLDLKLHDIPATMARATARAAAMGVDYLTVHAAAGGEALEEAQRFAGATRLLAVTVLTSLDAGALAAIGFGGGPADAVQSLGALAWDAGIRGFVTSAHECAELRSRTGDDAFIVTPGIRPAGSASGDQKRVMTPADALRAGADLLVVGRPVRDAADPTAAAAELRQQVGAAISR